ncbi:hypothetical protein BSS2_II0297 [Brucella suis bv. 1 str. S2]|uniref:Uncharacterized protein n=8 Tax=Brucella TaxID=234 RepID=Q2YJY9_BRUA2|nr:hypothetical protein BRA0312 [Brucella suis 1330]AAX76260.1 hypothetical protein BruAb2_0869 [Brucella abortus bv. 1 str. 9-941]ABQ62209.1 hypothetical protein BOV_A0288 [Brucella ovis ATCC 25840]ABY39326.1 Hypothetical protein, conserved [Brucella suis ATCC 23445]ACD74315.1 hypothetical protein BAbS19_II08220 [Brucella abortus S19]ACU49442.1 hypothetical protein BMI_II306 [Brucella microti CCM 4915]AEK55758.1 hypothetical protein BPI_II309 [Brucella pinnipedialis B2/94]AEU07461.1 hypothe
MILPDKASFLCSLSLQFTGSGKALPEFSLFPIYLLTGN